MIESKQAGELKASLTADHRLLTHWDWKHVAQDLHLSPREIEIVQGLFDDLDAAAISKRLGVSIHTIRTHLGRMYRKLQVNTHAAVMVRVFGAHLHRQNAFAKKNMDVLTSGDDQIANTAASACRNPAHDESSR